VIGRGTYGKVRDDIYIRIYGANPFKQRMRVLIRSVECAVFKHYIYGCVPSTGDAGAAAADERDLCDEGAQERGRIRAQRPEGPAAHHRRA